MVENEYFPGFFILVFTLVVVCLWELKAEDLDFIFRDAMQQHCPFDATLHHKYRIFISLHLGNINFSDCDFIFKSI